MAAVNNDIIRVTAKQTYLGQNVVNTFFYKYIQYTAPASGVATIDLGFLPIVVDKLTPIQDDGVLWPEIVWDNLTNGLDQFVVSTGRQGVLQGLPAASFMAWGFKLVRTDASTRHGSRRIVGVIEEWINGNTANPSQPQMDNATSAQAVPVIAYDEFGTVVGDLLPVIVGRCRLTDVGCEPGELLLNRINPIASARFTGLTSQVSRKQGHGN